MNRTHENQKQKLTELKKLKINLTLFPAIHASLSTFINHVLHKNYLRIPLKSNFKILFEQQQIDRHKRLKWKDTNGMCAIILLAEGETSLFGYF